MAKSDEPNGKTPDAPAPDEQFVLADSESGMEKPIRELSDAELNAYHGKLNVDLANERARVMAVLKLGLDRTELLVKFIGVIDFERERRGKASRIVTGTAVNDTIKRIVRKRR